MNKRQIRKHLKAARKRIEKPEKRERVWSIRDAGGWRIVDGKAVLG